jgi:hypothetical protein
MDQDDHLPAIPSRGTMEQRLPFVEVYDTELSIEQLGRAVMTNYEAGIAAGNEAANRFIAAGLQLIEAKSRGSNFEAFLRDHCNGLSHSRAYELIAIACGRLDEVRAKARERKRRFDDKQAARVRSGTDTKSQDVLLANFETQVDAHFRKMGDETRQRARAYVLAWSDDGDPILDLSRSA